MAHVEPQYNAAEPIAAARGVRMIDDGKEAELRTGDPAAGAVKRVASGDQVKTPQRIGCTERPLATLNPQVRDRIATQLRAMYATVVEQPVPDRFADLIAKLDADKRKSPGSDS